MTKASISCTGKREYPDFVAARGAARRTNNQRDSAAVQPYRCPICRHWHLGNHTPRRHRPPKVEIPDA